MMNKVTYSMMNLFNDEFKRKDFRNRGQEELAKRLCRYTLFYIQYKCIIVIEETLS